MKTNYAGINYAGPGSTVNMDGETGIRYGVISQNAVNPDAIGDIFQSGTDTDYEDYIAEAKSKLSSALDDYFHGDRLAKAVESAFDAISQDLADNYEGTGDCARMDYESDGYKLSTDSGGDLWVLKSPYFTYAQFCSPCAPGACYLTSPLETPVDGNKAYCLGLDWFDDDQPCPYPVYSVETGKQIVRTIQHVTCPNCKGTGKDDIDRIAQVRSCKVADIDVSALNVSNYDSETGTFDCFRCHGEKTVKETVDQEAE